MKRSKDRIFIRLIILFVILFLPTTLAHASPVQKPQWLQRFFKQDQKVIVIDAGHGGTDSGSVKNGIKEKDINLKIAIKLQKTLEKKGYKVVMTRSDDIAISLRQRAKLANQTKGDLFISIHQNSFKDSSVHGIEVFYHPQKETPDEELANCLQEALVQETGAKNRYTRSATNLVVIRESKMPACLIESAYISNEHERQLITTDDYQNKVVQGIIKGVENFLEQQEKSS